MRGGGEGKWAGKREPDWLCCALFRICLKHKKKKKENKQKGLEREEHWKPSHIIFFYSFPTAREENVAAESDPENRARKTIVFFFDWRKGNSKNSYFRAEQKTCLWLPRKEKRKRKTTSQPTSILKTIIILGDNFPFAQTS